MIKKKIIIATGGTGGHVFPAVSLAKNLEKNYDVKLTTDKRGYNFIKDYENLKIVQIFSTPLIKKNALRLFFSLLIIIISIFKSIFFLILHRPSIVIGAGGYSSFPICIAAFILRIKFIIYENNLIIGKTNRFLLPLANKIFVSYKELEGISRKYKNKIIQIGNIIRQEIINSEIKDKIINFENINVLVLGGSQAAKSFADELPQIFKKLKDSNLTIKVFQQCQKEQKEKLSEFYKKAKIDHEIFSFSKNIIDFYSKTNLVITRSGASVLGELVNINLPFISIPLPSSADNHQYKNAEFYKNKGYGYLLIEKDIKYKLYDLIKSIFKDKSQLEKIIYYQKQYSDKNVFNILKIEIEKTINEKN